MENTELSLSQKSSLKTESQQKMGLIGAIATMVGAMVGSSIFVMLGPIAQTTGPSLYLAFLIGSLPAIFGSAYYVQLGCMFPKSGGTYYYNKRLNSPFMGFLAGVTILFACIGAIGMLALGLEQYMLYYFPNIPQLSVAMGTVILFGLINYFGIKTANLIQIGMVVWMLVALLCFAVPGFFVEKSVSESAPFLTNGMSGLLLASALAFYSYAGYNIVAELGGNIREPKKNMPRAILLSLVIVTIIYVAVTYVVSSTSSANEWTDSNFSIPLMASKFLPSWIVMFIGLGGIMAIATTLNAAMMVFPQELLAIAKDQLVSEKFLTEHKKYGTPTLGLFTGAIISIILLVMKVDITTFATMVVIGFLLASVFTGFGARRAPKRYPDLYNSSIILISPKWLTFFCWSGIITSLFFSILAAMDAPLVGGIYLLLVMLSALYYRWKKSKK
ncbi:APC family permease [Bacillus sp. FJAT-47783]|uniref:APC family permease n=1 Tax=Bacillus sp. FJAT-47783 TaxID=2922712 RepID=UPI001FAB43E0